MGKEQSLERATESQQLELAENLCILIFRSLQEFLKLKEDPLSNWFLYLSGRYLSQESR
jgi:hypothetical protein